MSGRSASAAGWSAAQLAPWLLDPDRAAVLLDFDGTLAPIVVDPASARPLPGVVQVLASLAARYRAVAVISGRPGAFLAEHVAVPGVSRWGAYGLERVGDDGVVSVVADAQAWRDAVASVVDRARRTAPPGVGVEDKGVTVTLHVREAPAAAAWVEAFAAAEAERSGLALHRARMSVELRPPLGVDKGAVVEGIVASTGVTTVCFAGDDVGDLSAFAALDAVPTALRVAVGSDEAPPALLAAADIVVDGPAGLLDLLRALLPPAS